MKKLISTVLALVMILSLATVAFAADEAIETTRPSAGTAETVQGTITINGVTLENGKPAATYALYQILKLDSYDFTSGSYDYSYTSDAWQTFFTTGAGAAYVAPNEEGMLVWQGASDAERVAEFAKIALKYAQDNGIEATKDTAAVPAEYTTGENSIIFSGLELGYYLVDSTVGALCGLSTTNPDGIINSKNGAPSLDKQVQEDLGLQWGDVNSADIGQDVNFRITIHVHDGAQNYVLHDMMDDGLTFKPETVKVMVRDGSTGDETYYEPKVGEDVNYELKNVGEHSFEIYFSNDFCDDLNTNDRLIITYSAMLNRNAVAGNGTADNLPNQNKAYLSYGEDHTTTEDSTTTKTYGFDLVKTDGQNKLLDGSEFRIYSDSVGGTEITVVPLLDDNDLPVVTEDGYNMYRKARVGEPGTTVIVVRGKVRVVGLDNGVYWLEETKAPDGYNKITSRQKFTISDNNLDAIITNGIVSTNSGVQVINHTGSMLPETGGLGTLLFTVLGSTTALGTGVVLVTKKRMSKIKDED